MRKIVLVLLVLGACCPTWSGSGGTSTPPVADGGACVCDCPDGPPAPPALDMFCADDAHAGATCCRKVDGSEVGTCVSHECAAK